MEIQPEVHAQRTAWARGEKPYHKRRIESVKGGGYALLRMISFSPSISGFVFWPIRAFSPIVISLLPVMIKSWKGDDIVFRGAVVTWPAVIIITLVIGTLLIYNRIYDLVREANRDRNNVQVREQKVALRLSNATRRINEHFSPIQSSSLISALEEIRNQILVAIREQARIALNYYDDGVLEVSMVVFHDDECSFIKVCNRAEGIRDTGLPIRANDTMAYYVALTGTVKTVHHFSDGRHPFAPRGLTSDKPRYKSILLVPLLENVGWNKYRCMGVVTVDSERAYEFWGGRDNRIVIRIKPLLNLLALTLRGYPRIDVQKGEGHVGS